MVRGCGVGSPVRMAGAAMAEEWTGTADGSACSAMQWPPWRHENPAQPDRMHEVKAVRRVVWDPGANYSRGPDSATPDNYFGGYCSYFGKFASIRSHGCASQTNKSICGENQLGSSRLP